MKTCQQYIGAEVSVLVITFEAHHGSFEAHHGNFEGHHGNLPLQGGIHKYI